MISTVALNGLKNDGIVVYTYVPKENILKEMAAKIEEVKPAFFYLVRKFSERTSYSESNLR
jgi:hypothetical protein